jgi:hypothetical protein
MKGKWIVALAVVILASAVVANMASARLESETWSTPKLPAGLTPVIDGDPSEWTDFAYTDGVWTHARLTQQPWYNPEGFTTAPSQSGELEGAEAGTDDDLSVEYFSAWDDEGIYVAFLVTDNIFDNHSAGSGAFIGGDAPDLFIQTNGGFGDITQLGFADYRWRAGTADSDNPGALSGRGDIVRRISPNVVGENTAQFFFADVPESFAMSVVDPVGAHPDALGGDWMFEARITWEGYLSTTDPPFLPPYEDKEMGWAWFIWDADGAGSEAIFYIAHDSNDGAPASSSWTTFVGEEVAVETSSWGQVKQLFK